MTGRIQSRSYLKQTSVSPTTVGHSYHFANMANSDNDTLEEDAEEYALRPRGREKTRRSTSKERLDDIVFISKDINEGDTLNAIALQYCCTGKVSRTVSLQPSPEYQESSSAAVPLSSEIVGNFLQEVDRDIEQIVRCTDAKKDHLHEVVSALNQELNLEPEHRPVQQKDPYDGADWGLGWWTAVVIMVIVGIITPVFYFLYYEVLVKVDIGHSTVNSSQSAGPS
ncbi:hypothetical protein FKM82_000426 [Ascaphus truei]